MMPLFIIALLFAYRKDLKDYVANYDKKGQYVIYVVVIGLIITMLVFSALKWIES